MSSHPPLHLGAEPAITMVLHTWGQQLGEHYHLHCVVSGGGLGLDGRSWMSLPRRRHRAGRHPRPFLFPVAAMSTAFRHHYLDALAKLRQRGQLRYHGHSAALANPVAWTRLVSALEQPPWVVYCKAPFGGPAQVLEYLSRYTHRVAIANRRLLSVGDGVVRFEYRDYADHGRTKELPLPAGEFLRRFLLHVLPRGFMRIRHYGILANRPRATKLARARELLGTAAPSSLPERTTPAALASAITSAAGHLVTITSAPEQAFVEQVLSDAAAPEGAYWIGLRETTTEGVYAWVTGEPLFYTNWYPGEPNNAGAGENSGHLLWTAVPGFPRGLWNDLPDSGNPGSGVYARAGYVVELDSTPSAAPAVGGPGIALASILLLAIAARSLRGRREI